MLDDFGKAIQTIQENYAGLDGQVSVEYLNVLLRDLDRHSAYIGPKEAKDLFSQIDGQLVGIGVALKWEDDRVVIESVIPGTPAAKSGISSGETIKAVDDTLASDFPPTRRMAEVVKRLRGKVGQLVRLTILAADGGNGPRDRTATFRAQIAIGKWCCRLQEIAREFSVGRLPRDWLCADFIHRENNAG